MLNDTGKGILTGAGTVSHRAALEKAKAEYDKYRKKIINEHSSVEREYLTRIKDTQKKLESKHRQKREDNKGE